MHKNFAMMVLQTVSHARAEACPPPCMNTTNKRQPFGHRRGIKTSTRPIRFAQLVEPVLPLLGAPGCVLDAHLGEQFLRGRTTSQHPNWRRDLHRVLSSSKKAPSIHL